MLILYGYEWISMFFQVQSFVKLYPPRARKQRPEKNAELFTVRKETKSKQGSRTPPSEEENLNLNPMQIKYICVHVCMHAFTHTSTFEIVAFLQFFNIVCATYLVIENINNKMI